MGTLRNKKGAQLVRYLLTLDFGRGLHHSLIHSTNRGNENTFHLSSLLGTRELMGRWACLSNA